MLELLAEHEPDWQRFEIFQVDERVAPSGDPDRNLTHIRESLPEAALEQLRPMPVEAADLDEAAAAYGRSLPEQLDLVHLGLGPDGHTASLVPGDPVLDELERRVALSGPYQERLRMTLTLPVLGDARGILWLVTGDDKREALAKLLAGDPSVPAGRVRAADAVVVADAAAAS